jgi:hypothetical protein
MLGVVQDIRNIRGIGNDISSLDEVLVQQLGQEPRCVTPVEGMVRTKEEEMQRDAVPFVECGF